MFENTVNNKATPADIGNGHKPANVHKNRQNWQLKQQSKSLTSIDQVNLSYRSETPMIYSSEMTMLDNQIAATDLLRGLVLKVFEDQGINHKIATRDAEVDIDTLSPEEAQELIAEDGYFGVEKTSERIFNFAVGIAGGDPARIAAVREGVENGFKEALDAFGGWLPEISHDTYDAVMQKLDDWAGVDKTHNSEL